MHAQTNLYLLTENQCIEIKLFQLFCQFIPRYMIQAAGLPELQPLVPKTGSQLYLFIWILEINTIHVSETSSTSHVLGLDAINLKNGSYQALSIFLPRSN